LSKARRAGVRLKPPPEGSTSRQVRHRAERDYRVGQGRRKRKPTAKRSYATFKALKREGRGATSSAALARQTRQSARRRRHH
jgi:hypothetical protein